MVRPNGLERCKKCNGEYEIIGVDDPAIDPQGEFNLHAVERRYVNCGWISNLIYDGGTLTQRQDKKGDIGSFLKQ
jgi:hypothetical protein